MRDNLLLRLCKFAVATLMGCVRLKYRGPSVCHRRWTVATLMGCVRLKLYSERISVKLWRGPTQKSSLHDYFCFRTFPFYAVRTFSQLGKTYFFIAKKKCQLRSGKRHFIQIFWLNFVGYAQGIIYEFRRRFLWDVTVENVAVSCKVVIRFV